MAGGRDAERIAWVDTAKGVCIVLVVMMHSTLGVGEAFGREGFLHHVVAFAKPFRMPDFFLISGLFLARVIDRDWRSYGDKRILHFVYFYLLWLVIQSAFRFGQVSGGTVTGFVEHLAWSLVEPYSTLWFVYLLAVFSVVSKLLRGLPPLALLAGAACLEIAPIDTPWYLLNEFCERYVYFVAGWLLAPRIFDLAAAAVRFRGPALAGLAVWAGVNGAFAFSPSPVAGYKTLAELPGLGLVLGTVGAMAIVSLSALLATTRLAAPFAYAGERSIAVYLAFFLPMAATRTVLLKTGLIADMGWVSVIVTVAAVLVPLVLERLVNGTRMDVLFRRPAWARIRPIGRAALQPAE
ncbi:acyltransferase family protein [Salinarimonas soli]|uniref:Acyltransferase family protein n=2 Tax=Salinarimonas soli TaxID=1638099 RepID=A0A5B2V7Y9_9HYPH|nr:acyltransferase family protein [Salinarimonas soli]